MTPERCLIQAQGSQVRQAQFGHGLIYNIMMNNTPQAFVRGLNNPGCRRHRHLTDQKHGHLFKEQSKSTAFSGPGDIDPAYSMFKVLGPGYIGSKIAMVLKKVQMPPGEFPEVMSLALFSAHGTGIPGTPVSTDSNMELMRRFIGFKMLINNLPDQGQGSLYLWKT